MIIDFFIRPPLKSFMDSDLYSNWNMPRGIFSRLTKGRDSTPATTQGIESFIDEFDASGIDLGVVIGSISQASSRASAGNGTDELAEFINAYANRFRGICAVDLASDNAMQDVRRAGQMGMIGVCVESYIGTGGQPLNAPQFLDIYKAMEEEGLILVTPMNFMSGNNTSCNQPRQIEDLATACPKLKIVVPFSCYPKLNEFMAMAARYPDRIYSLPSFYFYYPCINTAQDQAIMYNHMLQDQVLYGSGYPMRSLTQALRESLDRNWLPDPREKFLCKNAAKLLGLNAGNA